MAFSDWPLSFGSINPEGWLSYMVPFLEHSHRLLATLVGLLVLAMFAWAYGNSKGRVIEVVLLVLGLALVFAIFIAAGAERSDMDRKKTLLSVAFGGSLIPIGWLIWSWRSRGWRLVEKLSALALLMVTAQAILGGLRVTEISNTFAVLHGCLAQAFFCCLILITMVAGKGWSSNGFRNSFPGLRRSSATMVLLISIQLVLGASMRHFHRHGLADHGILKTQGEWVPAFDEPIIMVLFLHKVTAFCIFFFAGWLFFKLTRIREDGGVTIRRQFSVVVGLIAIQILLGVSVIATGKSFWVTNIHVLNGLGILAFSFAFLVKSLKSSDGEAALAKS